MRSPVRTRRPRYHTAAPPSIGAFDTEACRGNLLVVCSPTSHFEPREQKDSPQRLLAWLFREARDVNFCYNLSYDRAILLKPLARRFKRGQRQVTVGPFRLSLLGNKSFTLTKKGSHHKRAFYDISGFYADGERTLPLEETAREFLGEGKLPDVDRAVLGTDPTYYPAHREEVIRYCMRDAELALRLGKLLISMLGQSLGFFPSRFNSKASISKAWIEVHHPELYRRKAPWKWGLARESFKGGIFLTRVLGKVEHAAEIDLRSQYGSSLLTLPRLDLLTRRISNTYHPEALLGAYRILIDYDGRLPLDPALRGRKRGQAHILYPLTKPGQLRPYTAAKPEMDYFVRTKRSFIVLMAEEWFGHSVPQLPEVSGLLERISALKAGSDTRSKVERMLLKTIVNAAYGCFAESKHGETDLTCWPYAAHITAECRAKIWTEWDHLASHGCVILSVNTDSIRYTQPLDWEDNLCPRCIITPGVGQFNLEFCDASVTHYQSGIAIIDKPDGTSKLRKRGKPLLTAQMLRGASGTVLSVPSHHVTGFFEAISQGRPDDIGVFSDPNDSEDDTKIDLASNLRPLGFDPQLLRFEVLNARPLLGVPYDFDEVTGGIYQTRRTARSPETIPPASAVPV